jgi:hypothetical protein
MTAKVFLALCRDYRGFAKRLVEFKIVIIQQVALPPPISSASSLGYKGNCLLKI